MHKRLTNLEYLGTTQVERSIRHGHRIALSSVGYMGANPVFKHIPARLDGKGNYFTEYIKKIKMGIPYTRVTSRLTEVRADSRAARLAVLPPRRTKMKTIHHIGGGTISWPDGDAKYIDLCGVK